MKKPLSNDNKIPEEDLKRFIQEEYKEADDLTDEELKEFLEGY